MAIPTTLLTGLLALLALWSIILAGVATKTASLLYPVQTRFSNSSFDALRNGSGLLAFDGFLTFFVALALAALFATGHGIPLMILVGILAVLFLLWLGGAAAFSSGFNDYNLSRCNIGECGVSKATVAFAWLGWITLLALLVIAILLLVQGAEDGTGNATSSSGGGPSFSMAGLRRNKQQQQAADVEKAPQPHPEHQATAAPAAAVSPYPQQHPDLAMPAAAAPGAPSTAAGASSDVPKGFHGQSPAQQAFSGAYGVPESANAQHQGANAPYDAAQAYAQQSPYAGQAPSAAPTSMPQPQAPTGWSVAPLGTQPTNGPPTAEIVAGEPRS
ncbi:hypothetical protein OC834_002497 [Tilletia horrida]|nr:hypothetical protein OC834_002497 [Tilletia horrida]